MPYAPKRLCPEPTCGERLSSNEKCPVHYRPWAGSKRRNRLPSNWRNIREKIMARDNHACYLCGQYAAEVDHIIPGDDHNESNLAAICIPCHRKKSALEGVEAKKLKRKNNEHP